MPTTVIRIGALGILAMVTTLLTASCAGGSEVTIILRADPTATEASGEPMEFPLFVTEDGVQEQIGTITPGGSTTIPASDVDRQFRVQRKDPNDPLCDFYGGGPIPADEIEVFFWLDLACA